MGAHGAGGKPNIDQLTHMIGNMAGKLVEEELRNEERHVDEFMNKLDNMDDDDLEKLRQARKRRMQVSHRMERHKRDKKKKILTASPSFKHFSQILFNCHPYAKQ